LSTKYVQLLQTVGDGICLIVFSTPYVTQTKRFMDLGKLNFLMPRGLVSELSQFLILSQLPLETTLNVQVVKIDLKKNHLAFSI